MEQFLSISFLMDLISAAIRLGTPLLLAGLGEIISEQAGILNIGLEGMMLSGAFAGYYATVVTGNPWVGLLAALLAGMFLALIHAWASIDLHGDQVVSGVALNIIALGLTSYLNRLIFGTEITPIQINTLPVWTIPGLKEIPLLGDSLFTQPSLVFIALLLVPIIRFLFRKTSLGLVIHAAGEYPLAAESMGISVRRVRYLTVMVAGALAGLGGAFLTIAQYGVFSNGMTSGRGFIVLAIVILGKWNPIGVLFASMLFGLANGVQMRLQALGYKVPYQFLLMLPYALTIITLLGVVGKTRAPSALGKPYKREEA